MVVDHLEVVPLVRLLLEVLAQGCDYPDHHSALALARGNRIDHSTGVSLFEHPSSMQTDCDLVMVQVILTGIHVSSNLTLPGLEHLLVIRGNGFAQGCKALLPALGISEFDCLFLLQLLILNQLCILVEFI